MRGPVPRNKEDDQVVYIDSDSAPRILFSGEDCCSRTCRSARA